MRSGIGKVGLRKKDGEGTVDITCRVYLDRCVPLLKIRNGALGAKCCRYNQKRARSACLAKVQSETCDLEVWRRSVGGKRRVGIEEGEWMP